MPSHYFTPGARTPKSAPKPRRTAGGKRRPMKRAPMQTRMMGRR